jgi:hypothetical protein
VTGGYLEERRFGADDQWDAEAHGLGSRESEPFELGREDDEARRREDRTEGFVGEPGKHFDRVGQASAGDDVMHSCPLF